MTAPKTLTFRWKASKTEDGLKVRTTSSPEAILVVTQITYRKKWGWTIVSPDGSKVIYTGPRCNTMQRAQLNASKYARALHSQALASQK